MLSNWYPVSVIKICCSSFATFSAVALPCSFQADRHPWQKDSLLNRPIRVMMGNHRPFIAEADAVRNTCVSLGAVALRNLPCLSPVSRNARAWDYPFQIMISAINVKPKGKVE